MATPDILDETFEGAGYHVTSPAWGESVGSGSTVDEDSTAVARPPGGGDQVLKIDKVSPNFVARTRWDYGSIIPITYTTFYVQVAAGPASNSTEVEIATGSDTVAVNRSWDVVLRRLSSGALVFYFRTEGTFRQYYGTGAGAGAITLNQWYKISVKYDYTNNAYEFLVDGNSVATGTVALTGVRYFWIGDGVNSVAATYYVDTFQVSSTGYVTGDTMLVVADASHAHAADSPVLAQAHTLAPADAAHEHDAEAPVLVQAHVLVVQSATHGHDADAPALAQAHTLAVAEAAHGHAADSPVLVSDVELEVDDALHAHSALGEGLPPTGIPDIGAYEYHPPALELEQVHILAVGNGAHAHAAEAPVLTQVHSLVVADAAHAHVADAPVLTQVHTLVIADGDHAHLADAPVLVQVHNLVVADALHAHAADVPVLTQAHTLAVAEALHAQSVDSPALTQAHVLALLDALHGHVVDPIILSQAHTLVVADGHHTHIAGAPVVLQVIPTTWQTEADKFVNEPVVLVEIALDSGTKRLAVDFVRPDNSAPYAGRILSLPNITTSIGDLNRTYEAADIEIIIADPDRDLRTAMQTEGLKNRELTVKLAFPNEDLAKALTIFSGRIYNYNPLDNMRFSIRAEQYVKNFSEMYPDKLITATDYPNAAEGMVELVIPIVWGTVSSATGPLKTFMVDITVDAEKHLVGLQYGSVLTVTNVRINGTLRTTPADYSIVGTDIDSDGKIHTVIEWEPGVRPTSSDLVTCDAEFLRPSPLTARGPVEAFVFFAMNFCGYIFDDFDPVTYADALAIEADRGYALDGIMAERKTLAAWKDEISNEFELDIWYDTATGLIKFQYLGGALDILAAPHYKDYKDILKYTPNQQVDLIGNWCRPGYNYDYALQNFQNYQFYEDVPSQTLHGGVYRLDPTLFFVRDSGTAYDLASRKIIRQRNPIAFEKFILPLKAFSLSLGTVVRMTHYDGPGPDGYDGDYFQLRRAELDLNNFVLSGEFELVANFYGDDFIFGDEDILAEDWLTASDADKYYGYLCDETTGEFSNGDHGKAMNE